MGYSLSCWSGQQEGEAGLAVRDREITFHVYRGREREFEMNQNIKRQALPPMTYVSSKAPSPVTSQKVPAAGDQAHMSLWRTFLIQITAKANL